MAKSGTISKTFATGYTLKITWEELNVDTANNQSDVKCTATLSATGSYHISSTASKNISLTINGTKYTGTTTVGISAGGSKTLMTKTLANINHGSDGSKSVSISCTLDIAVTLGGSYVSSVTASGTAALTTIARKSTLTASNGTLGTAQTLKVSAQSDSFTHTITYKCGGSSGTVCSKSSSTSISWTPPLSLASENTTGTTVTVKFTITTYSGSTSLGSNTKSITCSIPGSVKPSLSLTVEDAAGYQSTYGWIKGKSKIKATLTATASYGAAIKAYSTTANGSTYTTSSFTTGVLAGSGSLKISAKVTDARGRTATASTTITVLAYSKPAISGTSVKRCNADGTLNAKGSCLKVTFTAAVTSLGSKNTAAYKVQYKKKSAASYTTATLSAYAGKYSVSAGTYVFAADIDSNYDVILQVTDAFGTVSASLSGLSGEHFMSWVAKGAGLAFGKLAEMSAFLDVGWDAIFRKSLYMDKYSDAEKHHYWHNDAHRQGKTYSSDGIYPHGGRIYGGNGASKTSIGLYDDLNDRAIWRYNDVDNIIDSAATLDYISVAVTRDSSNVTAITSNVRAYPFMRMVIFNARFTTAALGAGSSYALGTVPSAYAPATVAASLMTYANTGTVAANMSARVGTGGDIQAYIGQALTAGKYIYLSGVWNY